MRGIHIEGAWSRSNVLPCSTDARAASAFARAPFGEFVELLLSSSASRCNLASSSFLHSSSSRARYLPPGNGMMKLRRRFRHRRRNACSRVCWWSFFLYKM